MHLKRRLACLGIIILLLNGCKTTSNNLADSTLNAQQSSTPAPMLANQAARNEFIRSARVWEAPVVDIRSADPFAATSQCSAFGPNDVLTCDYVPPKIGDKIEGWTPKFKCLDSRGKKLKVKYGITNSEVSAEVFSARFLQLLGYKADCDYPIAKIICQKCPADPFSYGKKLAAGQDVSGEQLTTREFTHAMIETPFGNFVNAEVDEKTIKGWGFDEFLSQDQQSLDPVQAKAREGLTLLMAMLQHGDNRRSNQALMCTQPINSQGSCDEEHRFLTVSDLGGTLGGFKIKSADDPDAGVEVPPALSYFYWDHAPIWKNYLGAKSSDCTAWVIAFDTNDAATLKEQKITEAGRKFLADLLSQVTDAQLKRLVEESKLDERQGDKRFSDATYNLLRGKLIWARPLALIPVSYEPVKTDKWVGTMRKKINKVLESACPSH